MCFPQQKVTTKPPTENSSKQRKGSCKQSGFLQLYLYLLAIVESPKTSKKEKRKKQIPI